MSGQALVIAEGVAPFGADGQALVPLDLTVYAGEAVALVGTHLSDVGAYLRILAGVEEPACGEVRFPWHESAAYPQVPVSAGYVSWRAPLVAAFSGVNNVKLPALYHRIDSDVNISQRVQALLAALEYEADHDVLPAYMSSLQRAHLLVVRALMLRPQVLCIDEPCHGLNRAGRDRMVEYLVSLCREGMGLVIAFDDLDFIARYAKQIVFVGTGMVRRFDSWAEFVGSGEPQIEAYLEPHRRDCRTLSQHGDL